MNFNDFCKTRKEYDITDAQDLIRDEIPEGLVLETEDIMEIVDRYRDKHDWSIPNKDQLAYRIEEYLDKTFPQVTYNIVFSQEGKTDETQFDVSSFKELGECWLQFCKENNLNPSCYSWRYQANDNEKCDIPYERLLQILQRYVDADLEAASELSYVRDLLKDTCGCDDAEIKKLGFGCLLEV